MEHNKKHPPTALRLELMLGQLRTDGWEVTLERLGPVCAWLDHLVSKAPTVEGLDPEVVVALREAHGPVVALARSIAGERVFAPADYEAQRELLEDLLALSVLPAQLDHEGHHADRRAVLLAGWLRQMAGRPPEALVNALMDRQFQAFLDKGLEMSAVLESWCAR